MHSCFGCCLLFGVFGASFGFGIIWESSLVCGGVLMLLFLLFRGHDIQDAL